MAEALPTSKVVVFGDPADPTADQRRSSNAGVTVFTVLLGILGVLPAALGVLIMNIATLSGGAANWIGSGLGFLAALCFTGGLVALLAAAGIIYKEGKSAVIAILALALFVPCLVVSLISASGFSYLSAIIFPDAPALTKPAAKFVNEPRQLDAIEASMTFWLENNDVPYGYVSSEGQRSPGTGAHILRTTRDCNPRFIRFAWERNQCSEWDYLTRERAARIECNSSKRKQNCGKTTALIEAKVAADGWPIPEEMRSKGRLMTSLVSPHALVFYAAFLGLVFGFCCHLLMNVKSEVPASAVPPLAVEPEPPVETLDHFETWRQMCVIPDDAAPNRKAKEFLANYKDWCRASDILKPLNDQVFYQRLASSYGEEYRVHSGGANWNGSVYKRLNLRKLT